MILKQTEILAVNTDAIFLSVCIGSNARKNRNIKPFTASIKPPVFSDMEIIRGLRRMMANYRVWCLEGDKGERTPNSPNCYWGIYEKQKQ